METIRAAAEQFEHIAGDKAANLDEIRHFTRRARRQGMQIICFTECCITGYLFIRRLDSKGVSVISEPVSDGPSSESLRRWARKCGMIIDAGVIERTFDGRFYDSYVAAEPNGDFHMHRKIHSYEHAVIASSSQYTVFRTSFGWNVGVLICYDNNIRENVRMTRLLGADLINAPRQTGGRELGNPNVMGRGDS